MRQLVPSSTSFAKLAAIAAVSLAVQNVRAADLFTDGFNYSAGGLNASDTSPAGLSGNAWSSGSSHISVVNGDLTYPSLLDLGGNEVQDTWGVSAGSVINTYAAQSSGSIYYSFLIDCTTAPSANQYLTSLNPGTGAPNGSSDALQVDVGPASGGYEVGLRTAGASITLANVPLSLGNTYMVVAEYTFGSPGSAALYLDPVIGAAQPSANVTLNGNGTVTSIDDIGFKAQTTTTTGTFLLDNVLIGTTWADVTPQSVPEPSSLALICAGLAGVVVRLRRPAPTRS